MRMTCHMVSTMQLTSQGAPATQHAHDMSHGQHVLAGCSTAATPRPPQPDLLRYGSFYNFGGDILLNSVYVHIYTHHV